MIDGTRQWSSRCSTPSKQPPVKSDSMLKRMALQSARQQPNRRSSKVR
jgi:hypothetical protein